jgi:hypothetical protein
MKVSMLAERMWIPSTISTPEMRSRTYRIAAPAVIGVGSFPAVYTIKRTMGTRKTISRISVSRPTQNLHVVSFNEDLVVDGISSLTKADIWINGG